MAEYKFTAALNAADIPPIVRSQQRSILIGQLDNKLKDPASSNTTNQDNNPQNLPQVVYAENVVPTQGGVMSVGYSDVGAAFPGAGTADDVYVVRRQDNAPEWLVCPAGGYNYIKGTIGGAWVADAIPGAPVTAAVSMGYVYGGTQMLYAGTWFGAWDVGTNTFSDLSASLVGIVVTDMVAICSSGNYLIAIGADNQIHWSSLVDPLDFTPSTVTGAGFQIPLDLRGDAIYLTPTSGGFLIHCTENVVAAVYTNNVASPWIFREVKGSGGVRDRSTYDVAHYRIAKESSSGVIYQFGTHGLQALNLREAENIQPQVTDFLAGRAYETFDTVTNAITLVKDVSLRAKVSFLLNRYLIMSYGLEANASLSYALIYDATLKRWGKLKVDHADIFAFQDASSTAKDAIYIVTDLGVIKRVVLDQRTLTDSAVLLLGRYQLNRTAAICSQELELEVLDAAQAVTAHVLASYNGTTVGSVTPMIANNTTDNYRQFQLQVEGVALWYLLKGTFSLATALITATKGAAT